MKTILSTNNVTKYLEQTKFHEKTNFILNFPVGQSITELLTIN